MVARATRQTRVTRDDGLLIEGCFVAGQTELYSAGSYRAAGSSPPSLTPSTAQIYIATTPPLRTGSSGGPSLRRAGPRDVRPPRLGPTAWRTVLAQSAAAGAQPNSVAALRAQMAHVHLVLRDAPAARAHAEAAIAVASEHELPLWLGLGRMYRGAALVEAGLLGEDPSQVAEGIAGVSRAWPHIRRPARASTYRPASAGSPPAVHGWAR